MDYEFNIDNQGQAVASFSMGHEAIGRWLTDELGSNNAKIEELLDIVEKHEQKHLSKKDLRGKDFRLRINQDVVEVIAHSFGLEADEPLPEDTNIYDEAASAECGLMDFKQALLSWQEFVSE